MLVRDYGTTCRTYPGAMVQMTKKLDTRFLMHNKTACHTNKEVGCVGRVEEKKITYRKLESDRVNINIPQLL